MWSRDEYEKYVNESIAYGIFDKWFYYNYLLLAINENILGYPSVKDDFVNSRLDRWFRQNVCEVPQSLIEKNIRKISLNL